jgi:hypothetical protein
MTLATYCYYGMFEGCTNLNSINVNFSAWDPTNATKGWVTNVSSSGTFTCPEDLPETYGINYIPSGWSIVRSGATDEPEVDYLCFTAEQANSTVKMSANGSAPTVYLETSPTAEEGTWSDFTVGSTTITLANVGDKVYFRAKQDNERFATSSFIYNYFSMTGKIAASGNLNTLLKADGSIVDLTGRDYCYVYMFENCSSLTQAPELPATTLATSCYTYMFSGCSGLTQAPALPAMTLVSWCYSYMFQQCTSLTSAPALPATTLADYCYDSMF